MDLIDCIAFIKAELNKLPAPDHSTPEARADRQKAKAAMIATIEQSLPKAKINDKWNGATVSIAGIRASSTSGIVGALHNWIAAARRRLDQTGFIQTNGEKENVR